MSARTVALHVRVSPETHAALAARAAKEGRPLANLLAFILDGAAVAPSKATLDPEWDIQRTKLIAAAVSPPAAPVGSLQKGKR